MSQFTSRDDFPWNVIFFVPTYNTWVRVAGATSPTLAFKSRRGFGKTLLIYATPDFLHNITWPPSVHHPAWKRWDLEASPRVWNTPRRGRSLQQCCSTFTLHKASQRKIQSHLANILCQKKTGLGFVSVLKLLVFLVLRLKIQLSVACADGPLYPSLVIWGQRNKSSHRCVYKFNPAVVGVWVSVIQRSFIFISKYFSAAINSGRCREQLDENAMLVFIFCVGDGIVRGGCEAAVHTQLSCLCVTVCHTLEKKHRRKRKAELSSEKVNLSARCEAKCLYWSYLFRFQPTLRGNPVVILININTELLFLTSTKWNWLNNERYQ